MMVIIVTFSLHLYPLCQLARPCPNLCASYFDFVAQSRGQNFSPNSMYNYPHKPPFLLKTLYFFKQFENKEIVQCWERHLELLHFFSQHGSESWQIISYFYNKLIEKSCQVLNILSEESFVEIEPIIYMMILDNFIERKTHEPNYEEINEVENVDVHFDRILEYLYSQSFDK